MGLAEQQAVLAKLYTDGAVRKEFYADPPAVGKRLGLSPDDLDEIVRVPRKQIEGFARSLVAKRRSEVEKFLPMARRLLGPAFIPLFNRHADLYLPTGSHRHREDALAFASSIAGGSLSAECAEHVRDIARFERALIIARSKRRPQFCFFRHDVRMTGKTDEPGPQPDRGFVYLMIYPSGWGQARVCGFRLR